MYKARRAGVSLYYKGKDISTYIQKYLKGITYTDVASGSSDSVSIELEDELKEWMEWYPEKGEKIKVDLFFHNWEKQGTKKTVNCGSFTVDQLSFSGRPFTCKIEAAAAPQSESFNATKRTKTWKKATIEQIAKTISERSGLKLYYEAETITIQKIEQSKQEDCKFLYGICEDYGLSMKVYNDKLIIFNEEEYEKKKSVDTIYEDDKSMISWDYTSTLTGTYTGVRVSYSNPKTDKTEKVTIGNGKRILEVNVTASSKADAEKKGKAKLKEANKKENRMSLSLVGKFNLCAATCVDLKGFRRLSGKYYIEKVKHRIDANSRTTTDVELRKVE